MSGKMTGIVKVSFTIESGAKGPAAGNVTSL